MTAHSTGCTTSSRDSARSSCSTAVKSQSTKDFSAAAQSAMLAANTGADSSSSTAIPVHCAPWPGNTNTGLGVLPGATARTTRVVASPRASRRAEATSSALSVPRTTARWSNAARVCARVCATSAGSSSPAASASLPACARSASAVLADSSHASALGRWSTGVSAGGVQSVSTTWQLVPPMPNALTPATSGLSGWGQAPVCCWTRRFSRSREISGLGRSKFRLGTSFRCLRHSAALSSPTTPAAPSRWPMLVLAEPTSSGLVRSRAVPSAAPSAAASIGSPILVPVPCSSTYWTSAGSMSASW